MLDDQTLSKQALLSAFFDGEASEQEQIQLAKKLAQDGSLGGGTLARYQKISQAIQAYRQLAPTIDAGQVAHKVQAKLSSEPTVLAPKTTHKTPSALKPFLLGGALAAAVAVLAVLVAPQLIAPQQAVGPPQVAATPTLQTGVIPVAQSSSQRWDTLQPEVRQQLDRYLVEHNELAGRISVAKRPNVHITFVSIRHTND